MVAASCIPVPSPQDIARQLFPKGRIKPIGLPQRWAARLLLTPPGGIENPKIMPSDQVVAGDLIYEAGNAGQRSMRVRLYLLESLRYYDFFFRTSGEATEWWWLVSRPSDAAGRLLAAYGPYATAAIVPPPDFLVRNRFSHVGTWAVLSRPRHAFSARDSDQGSPTWYWFDPASRALARIMNVDVRNGFAVPVLGAYYLVDVPRFSKRANSPLAELYRFCVKAARPGKSPSPMVTFADLLSAMAAPPTGKPTRCRLRDIQALIPGLARPKRKITPPAWTNRVESRCLIIGQPRAPFYGQVWYDWNRGAQVTVMVNLDGNNTYTERVDELLLRAPASPQLNYAWDGRQWMPQCCFPNGGGVPPPRPDFVAHDHGRCRAVLANRYFGKLTIWSTELAVGGLRANFWFWFNERQEGVLFALAPSPVLTLIDYQSFVQDGTIADCTFANPCGQLPVCQSALKTAAASLKFFPG